MKSILIDKVERERRSRPLSLRFSDTKKPELILDLLCNGLNKTTQSSNLFNLRTFIFHKVNSSSLILSRTTCIILKFIYAFFSLGLKIKNHAFLLTLFQLFLDVYHIGCLFHKDQHLFCTKRYLVYSRITTEN